MKRLISSALVLSILLIPFSSVNAQTSRYRLPTQAGSDQGPAPSFRGGDVEGTSDQEQEDSLSLQGTTGGGVGALGASTMLGTSYQVHVLGEVKRPGTYKVTASDRLSEVIRKAGGFAQNGSQRNIELRRGNKVIKRVDLLEFTLFGNLEENPYLNDNDVVFVPLRAKVVKIVGAVKRPDTYELKNETSLFEVVELAGGFNSAMSTKEPVRVVRFEDGDKKLHEIESTESIMKDFPIMNGDVIVIPNMITAGTKFDYNVASIPGDQVFYPSYEDRVFVLGGVAAPGAYEFSPYYTVNQYVSLAGGVNDRGSASFKIINIDGKTRKVKGGDRVNPGETLMIKQHWMSPAAWVGFIMGIASFGLSASATVLALRK